MAKSVEMAIHPQNYDAMRRLPANQELARKLIPYGLVLGDNEFYSGMGAMTEWAGKVRLDWLLKQTYGRSMVAFTGPIDFARLELGKALLPTFERANQLPELARLINHMTGTISTVEAGIGVRQSVMEGIGLFAPRYTRAGFALIGDIFRGNLTAHEARRSLGQLLVGGMAAYVGFCKLLGQEPNINPKSAKVLSIRVGDSYIGIGGFYTSLARFAADVAASINPAGPDGPMDFLSLYPLDNPLLKFMFMKGSPLVSIGLEAWHAINDLAYFGQEWETPSDYAKWAASWVTPIAYQDVLETGKVNPAALAAELFGARTWEIPSYEKRNDLREILAKKRGYTGWDDPNLTNLERDRILREEPSLQWITKQAEKEMEARAR